MASSARSPLVSATISLILSVVIFASLRFFSEWLTSSQMKTILGGYLGSWLFIFSLTMASNTEMFLFGNDFQAKFIPEVLFCLGLAVVACGMVHRVCVTSCIIFSMVALYFINRISNQYYLKNSAPVETSTFRKSGKKNK